MKKLTILITLVAICAFFGLGCGTANDDVLADFYGSWSSDVVPISGVGHYDGVSIHEFNEDGSYRTEIEFTDPNSGCHVTIYYAGTFTGDANSLQFTPTEGEVMISSCNDDTANASNRSFTEEEIAAASSSVEWTVEGDTLTLYHEDGMNRIYKRK